MTGRTFLAILAGVFCFIVVYGIELGITWLVRGRLTQGFQFEIMLGFPALFFAIVAGLKVNGAIHEETSDANEVEGTISRSR